MSDHFRPLDDYRHWEFWAFLLTFMAGFTVVTAYAEAHPFAAVLGAILLGYHSRKIETWAKEEIDAKPDRRALLEEEWGGSHE